MHEILKARSRSFSSTHKPVSYILSSQPSIAMYLKRGNSQDRNLENDLLDCYALKALSISGATCGVREKLGFILVPSSGGSHWTAASCGEAV